MKLEDPKNSNYAAVVVKIKNIVKLDNCDNVVATPIFGFQGIVGKNTQVGDLGIVFPAETRLSPEYLAENNLYRHNENNKDKAQKGYIEDNGRVKAVKFRGHRSDCLFMPLSSLAFTGVKLADLNEGDIFDQLDGHSICEKYERPRHETRAQQLQRKAFKRIDAKFLPEHYDTENYFRNQDNVSAKTPIIVTQKLHGTSIRIGNTITLLEPTLFTRILKFLRIPIKETEFDYIYGSRKVIKNDLPPRRVGFYGSDLWSKMGKEIEALIPQNYVLYGELVGWTDTGAPIQKKYTYTQETGTCKLYIYRIAMVNAQGLITDLSWDHVREFCKQRGLNHVPELWRGPKGKFDPQKFIDIRFADEKKRKWTDSPVPLDDNGSVDEGVCVRIDTICPTLYKAKSPAFLQYETKLLDEGAEDLEANESVPEAE